METWKRVFDQESVTKIESHAYQLQSILILQAATVQIRLPPADSTQRRKARITQTHVMERPHSNGASAPPCRLSSDSSPKLGLGLPLGTGACSTGQAGSAGASAPFGSSCSPNR